jgi:penicillin amidase
VLTKRILRLINLSIAIFVVALLFAAYWTAWRPLPKLSGTTTAPISKAARVDRDRRGSPHITAATWQDAIFLQGYITAQDRMWQMDAVRRLAAGELSEVIGKTTLDADREARRLRMRRVAEDHAKSMGPDERAVLAEYARGINYYIQQNRGKYSVEFAILRYDPRPWTIVDSVLVGMQMFLNLTNTWKEDHEKMTMAANGDPAKVDFLFPVRSGAEPSPGSNSWAVAGSRTASGKPILASDPHLEYSLPSTWYLIHLTAPGLNVSGASLPGLPAVIIGHNDRIAWGATNLHYDVMDLYREKLNVQTGQYLYNGKVEQAALENEVIAVKNDKPVPLAIWRTRHGPAFLTDEGVFYALRWAAAEPEGFEFPLFDLNRAQNWQQFTSALSRYRGPAQNWTYADVDGNIGYHAAGRLPVRRTFNGDVPLDGSTGTFEWDGFIPFDQLPAFYNPPSGLIVTANQNPFPADYPYRVGGGFASHYRALQIRAMLESRRGWKPAEMLAVQKDVYSAFAQFLAKQAVAACNRRKAEGLGISDAVEVLRDWNGQMDKDSPAALVTELLYQDLRKTVAERAAPKRGNLYGSQMAAVVIERLLRERPQGWFKDYDETIVSSLRNAIDEGAKQQGSNVKGWRYGAWNVLAIPHPVVGRLPLIGKYFNIGPVWMSGSSTTVKQTTRRLGPSMRMVVDLSNLDNSFQNVTIGESGHILSNHYSDEWDSYYVGNSLPMEFNKVNVESRLQIVPGR